MNPYGNLVKLVNLYENIGAAVIAMGLGAGALDAYQNPAPLKTVATAHGVGTTISDQVASKVMRQPFLPSPPVIVTRQVVSELLNQ